MRGLISEPRRTHDLPDFQPLEWRKDRLIVLDQRLLPQKEVYLEIAGYQGVVEAIRTLAVRGAPAIGIAAAYGLVLAARAIETDDPAEFRNRLEKASRDLAASRPTARNLFWALETLARTIEIGRNVPAVKRALLEQSREMHKRQKQADLSMAHFGSPLFEDNDVILTHCNTGALATGGFGTALGVIKQAYVEHENIRVVATETRPLLQGARLTAFELQKAGIPFTLITDSMAGSFMRRGKVQAVIVGADRIAANGDTANKVGTYSLAVLAHENSLPFYVAAPVNTVDLSLKRGEEIVIEERRPEEVTRIQGIEIAPEGVQAANPAFDVTPQRYIAAIITEKGVARPPYSGSLERICSATNSPGGH